MHQNFKIYTIAFAIFIFAIFGISFASAPLSCYYNSVACNTGETRILGISSQNNAHAELANQVNYPESICCSGVTDIGSACSGNYANYLNLSSLTNAHVEKINFLNYHYGACLSASNGVNCYYSDDCGGDVCIVSISSDTNAHVASCASVDYTTKVCCNIAAAPLVTDIYWADMKGNRISGANRSDAVMPVVKGNNIGSTFNYSIYKKSFPFDSPAGEIQNQAVNLWRPQAAGTYYFKVRILGYGELEDKSNELSVTDTEENSPPVSIIVYPNYANTNNYFFKSDTPINFQHASYDVDDDMRNATFEWDFGNNVKSGILVFANSNTSYSYSDIKAGGGKDVTLTVTDLRGKQSVSKVTIYINTTRDDPPAAIITSPLDGSTWNNPTVLCDGTKSIDDITPFDNLIFTWKFNDNDPSHVNIDGSSGGALFYKQYRFSSTPEYPHWVELTVQD